MKRFLLGLLLVAGTTAWAADKLDEDREAEISLERVTYAARFKNYLKVEDRLVSLKMSGGEIVDQSKKNKEIFRMAVRIVHTQGADALEEGFVRAHEVGAVFKALKYLTKNNYLSEHRLAEDDLDVLRKFIQKNSLSLDDMRKTIVRKPALVRVKENTQFGETVKKFDQLYKASLDKRAARIGMLQGDSTNQ